MAKNKIGVVFPGQGSQESGMGKNLYDEWDTFRREFEILDGKVERDLHNLCFNMDDEKLKNTSNTQPSTLTVGYVTFKSLCYDSDITPKCLSGHSLGQFTALTSAGAISEEEAVELVSQRGRIMENESKENPGKMVALLNVNPDIVSQVCKDYDLVGVAGYNTPKQTVLSGDSKQVDSVVNEIREKGRIRSVELDVGEAFHSPLMKDARAQFSKVLERIEFANKFLIPVVSDTSGEIRFNSDGLKEELEEQIVKPIDWVSVVKTMESCGVDWFIEVPPSGTLDSMISSTANEVKVTSITDYSDVEMVINNV